jgi:hypothetical protein
LSSPERKSDLPLVDVYLNGIEVLAAADSGAAVSVMSSESANKLKSKRVKWPQDQSLLWTVHMFNSKLIIIIVKLHYNK